MNRGERTFARKDEIRNLQTPQRKDKRMFEEDSGDKLQPQGTRLFIERPYWVLRLWVSGLGGATPFLIIYRSSVGGDNGRCY